MLEHALPASPIAEKVCENRRLEGKNRHWRKNGLEDDKERIVEATQVTKIIEQTVSLSFP